MTREEARAIAAGDWLGGFAYLPTIVVKKGDSESIRLIKHQRELIRRYLERLANPKKKSKAS